MIPPSRPPRDGVGPGYDDWKSRSDVDEEERWKKRRRYREDDK